MPLGIRHFLVDDDAIRPLTQSVSDRLRRGGAALPEYAGRDLHVVDVTVEIKNRAPVKVRKVGTAILSLDEHGALRSRLLEDLRASVNASRTGRVPARARWSPSKAQLERITELALGRAKLKLKPPKATTVPDAGSAGRPAAVRRSRRPRRRNVATANVGE